MTVLKIVEFPHPILKKVARKVGRAAMRDMPKLASDMLETMIEANGIGLAAPQIGKSLRMFIATIGDEPRVFVNPQILEREGFDVGEEGCLSFPGLYGMVERPTYIKVRYQDAEGREHIDEFEGFPARVILHENDHLDGILINDRATELYRPADDDEESADTEINMETEEEKVEAL
ncbi:MAG: peptide deformylase [bacterium]